MTCNTPFVERDNIADVIKALGEIGENLVNWFSNNEMKLNIDKCRLILNSQEPNTLKIGDFPINNSLGEKQTHSQELHHTWDQPKNVFS